MTEEVKSKGSVVITQNTTLVTVPSSDEVKYLICDINGKGASIPLYKLSVTTPELDLIKPKTDLIIHEATLVDSATAYNAGIALNIFEGYEALDKVLYNFAVPLYKTELAKTDTTRPALQFRIPTMVTDIEPLTGSGNVFQYMLADINNEIWGIPLYKFNAIYSNTPSLTSAVNQSDVCVTTLIETNPTQWDAPRSAGSTNLNNKIGTYSDLVNRIKMELGWPVVQIEVCDEQIVDHLDKAIEWYTKYAGFTEEFLVFDSNLYERGLGLKMDEMFSRLYCMEQIKPYMSNEAAKKTEYQKSFYDFDIESYRKVVDIWSFDEAGQQQSDYLFSLEYVFAQQTYFSYVLGNYGFDLVTWHVLKDWMDTREKMFALRRRYYFDDRSQRLKLTPEPMEQRFVGVVGAYVERPIKDVIKERWVFQYSLALTKITIGNIRGKFGQVSMFGGASINYNDLLSQGLEEKKQLELELLEKHGEVAPIKFFVG